MVEFRRRFYGGFFAAALPLLLIGVAATAAPGDAREPGGRDAKRQAAQKAAIDPKLEALFESRVRPTLIQQCFGCHGESGAQAKLRLDSRDAMLKGGLSGPAIVPGDPDASLILTRAHGKGGKERMPLGGAPLSPVQIEALTLWIKAGAPWPESPVDAHGAANPMVEYMARAKTHWAFTAPKLSALPKLKNSMLATEWVKTPLDHFVLAKLESKKLLPAPPASKAELIRRVTYDLIGLPPTPGEVAAFVNDTSDSAYGKLVDRLLESPRYGEKWGRHWLDLVRFAETNSYERDGPKPGAWRYRDWVIRAINADKPYDRFVTEQLAGDEIPGGGNDGLIATGFYRLGIWDDEPTDREQARYDSLDDIVATVGQTFLGLTLDCARCHDHKIDPIPQKDYYRFVAFFQNVNHYRNGGPTDERPLFENDAQKAEFDALNAKRGDAQNKINAIRAEFNKARNVTTDNEPENDFKKRFDKDAPALIGNEKTASFGAAWNERTELDAKIRRWDRALIVTEAGPKAPETNVLLRGSAAAKGDVVGTGFPQCVGGTEIVVAEPAAGAQSTGRRLALAKWIVDPKNALTSRVMVNRVFQHHFGRGLVRSANNFGLQGDAPTHAQLLDYLAVKFATPVEKGGLGYSLKRLHRLMLLSSTYKMSSRAEKKALALDPENDLLWRFNMRRLTAEEIRDSILAVNGTLNLQMFGPGVYPKMPAAVLAGQSRPGEGWGNSPTEQQGRRSVYIHVKRSLLYPLLESFDMAETDRTSPVRFATTQPTQALGMINSEFVHEQSRKLAERAAKDAGPDLRAQVSLVLALVTQRTPTAREIDRGEKLVVKLKADGATDEQARAWFALVALNLNEFAYLD